MRSKRYLALKALVDQKKAYALPEAVDLIKKTATAAFDSTVEMHVKLGIDPKKGEQQVRGTIPLPHGSGQTKRIAAFVSGEKAKDAKDAGADLVGAEELIDEIGKSGKINFDIAVATPDMMPKLAKVAKILGPKGLMPNPKTETVSNNVKKMVEELKRGKISFKNDETGNVHLAVGRASFDAAKLIENIQVALEALRKARPASAKGTYLPNATLTSSMGPAIKIQST